MLACPPRTILVASSLSNPVFSAQHLFLLLITSHCPPTSAADPVVVLVDEACEWADIKHVPVTSGIGADIKNLVPVAC